MPLAALRREAAEVVETVDRACSEADTAVAAHRTAVERARREADFLRHAVEELRKLAPEEGEEPRWPRDARGDDAGRESRRRSARRTCRCCRQQFAGGRRSRLRYAGWSAAAAQAPDLIEPAARAFDGALNSIEEARSYLDRALATADHDPAELERIEERLFALRAAGRKYAVPVDNLAALTAKQAADLELIDAGAERLVNAGEGGA